MKDKSSRRTFLAAGLTLPAAALASTTRTGFQGGGPKLVSGPAVELKYRVLGKTGLKVTSVGFGCMITSDQSVIEKAADIGITYFDTARGYQQGNNEKMVGAALRNKRKNLVLSSKTGALTKEEALNHLNTSLKELGTDYLDIWYLHGKGKADQLTDPLLEAQQVAKKEGKIRFAGVSMHGGHADVIPAAIIKKLDVVLCSYNFTMDPANAALLESAAKAGLGVVAMKVMAGGFRRLKQGEKYYDILKREGAMLAALKWVLKDQNIHTTIPSMTDMDQLDENLKAMSLPFGDADQKLLAAQLDYIRPLYCRMCGKCGGACPNGLPVSDMVRFLSYADGYGEYPLGRERFLSLPKEVRDIRCNLCPTCSVHCPNGVHVAERLSRAQEVFA
ncbi:MAG TPA: aldo/keto reductase [Acidobacteriota bacterium]|nr:aldo/keto reductase [Acidobacteriota bacterium]